MVSVGLNSPLYYTSFYDLARTEFRNQKNKIYNEVERQVRNTELKVTTLNLVYNIPTTLKIKFYFIWGKLFLTGESVTSLLQSDTNYGASNLA